MSQRTRKTLSKPINVSKTKNFQKYSHSNTTRRNRKYLWPTNATAGRMVRTEEYISFSDGDRKLHEYQVVGRKLPSAKEKVPRLYRLRLFAPNEVVAKSRFWYFLKKLKKVKKAAGELVSINEIFEKKPLQIKNYGIWLRYDSRSELTPLSPAVNQDMAARHRARFSSIQIIRVAELTSNNVRRPYIKQLLVPRLRFPLPHRVARGNKKSTFLAKRPSTFY
ncbi:7023_t:CDS:2 [Ambispora gerdemannii]|uniref:7023_t:CDS:1 n=1 Tax=Ambispora gerdemannii TaxID=144530 RepID=A0A9N8W7X0_9GLOM|nr:7023_t:CDS:2 [Ambispora gerdemannii]